MGQQVTLQSYADVTVRSGSVVTRIMQFYLAENQRLFPGVQVQKVYVTHYPFKTLAAQVLGTVGPINADELKAKSYPGAARTDIVGQSGLEAQYDSFLRGKDGRQQVQVNALNQPTGDLRTYRPGRRPRPQAVAQRPAAAGGPAGAGGVDERRTARPADRSWP